MLAALRDVQIPEPARVAASYPHELSGGMQQRAMIASALIRRPRLIVADEPTTALDATVQHQILELLAELRTRINASLILISHDLAVVANVCDRVYVMYAGQIVERGPAAEHLRAPATSLHAGAGRFDPRSLGAERATSRCCRVAARHGRAAGGMPVSSALPSRDGCLPKRRSRRLVELRTRSGGDVLAVMPPRRRRHDGTR